MVGLLTIIVKRPIGLLKIGQFFGWPYDKGGTKLKLRWSAPF
jgi:hypothetical protein